MKTFVSLNVLRSRLNRAEHVHHRIVSGQLVASPEESAAVKDAMRKSREALRIFAYKSKTVSQNGRTIRH